MNRIESSFFRICYVLMAINMVKVVIKFLQGTAVTQC